MPNCPRCGTAYLEGEGHRCGPKTLGPASRALLGAFVGGALGCVLVSMIFCLAEPSPQCPFPGIFIGGPVGAFTGAIVAMGLENEKPND